jgi:anaerobic magnesium-protoporphyrin IX monomethyl ester cyclase
MLQPRVGFVIEILRKIFCRGINHRKWFNVIEHLVVEPLDHMLHDVAQVFEIEQQSSFVEFSAGERDTNLVVVPVRVFALALVVAQVMSGCERIFNSNFEHAPPAALSLHRARLSTLHSTARRDLQSVLARSDAMELQCCSAGADCGRDFAAKSMNVLLLSMPDSFEHMPSLAIRMPNGALTSIAGNVDPQHRVAVADLILVQQSVPETVTRLVRELDPDIIGLSVMTFQRRTASRIVELIRALKPEAKIVVGGYDPSLAPESYEAMNVDYLVRGEGEVTFRELLRALDQNGNCEKVCGLSFRSRHGWVHNPARSPHRLEDGAIRLPRRQARVLKGYTLLGRQVDVVETSRGCTFDCSFCSIIEMRGRNFFTYSFNRVLADIGDARDHGARTIFLVDDNIMLNVRRFEALCEAIIAAGLDDLDYFVQAMTSSIANHGETLAPLMKRAGFRYVFLGIENILEGDLEFLKASAKNTARESGHNAGNATLKAIDFLHRSDMLVVGGLIVGNPNDTPESIEANLEFARSYVDWPYIQHPTPYPRTPMTKDFREQGFIQNDNLEEYDGTTAVVRTQHMAAEEVEFLRWKAERWMKTRHVPAVFRHDPWFVLKNGCKMLAHTFRGSSFRSLIGLEDERRVFQRYKAIRRAEREYV